MSAGACAQREQAYQPSVMRKVATQCYLKALRSAWCVTRYALRVTVTRYALRVTRYARLAHRLTVTICYVQANMQHGPCSPVLHSLTRIAFSSLGPAGLRTRTHIYTCTKHEQAPGQMIWRRHTHWTRGEYKMTSTEQNNKRTPRLSHNPCSLASCWYRENSGAVRSSDDVATRSPLKIKKGIQDAKTRLQESTSNSPTVNQQRTHYT